MFSSKFVGLAILALVAVCSIALLGHLPAVFPKRATGGEGKPTEESPAYRVSTQPASHRAIASRGPFIAYVAPSHQNREIWLVRPDGSDAQKLWWAPANTAAHDGVGSLAWRPDGRAVTFDSGHAWAQSLGVRDLYTVPLAGGAVLRPTEMPDPSTFSSFPQGSVKVSIGGGTPTGRELMVYVQGAASPVGITAAPGQNYDVTIPNVADFGLNVRQYAHIYDKTGNGDACWDDVSWFVYVHPRTTVVAGTPLGSWKAGSCTSVYGPSWSADQRSISYLVREAAQSMLLQPVSLWKIQGEPAFGDNGERLLAAETGRSELFYLVSMNPVRSRADQFLLAQTAGVQNPSLFLSSEQDPGNLERIDLGRCPHLFCNIMGIVWFPSGDGFFFSRLETGGENFGSNQPAGPNGSYVYAFDLSTHALTEILRVPQDVIGRISASPDGSTLVFERAPQFDNSTAGFVAGPRPLCPCSIWVVNRDGSGLRRIVDDGRAPAWSPL